MSVGPQRPQHEFDPASIPPEFGSQPIPEGMVRFHHYTRSIENLPSIMNQGLLERHAQESYARGGTEAPITFATAGAPDMDFKRSHAFVEGWANPVRGGNLDVGENWQERDPIEHAANMEGRRNTITFRGDVPPHQLLAAHQPWHEIARYMATEGIGNEKRGSMRSGVAQGEYDWIDKETGPEMTKGYQPALNSVRVTNAATVMLGGKL